MKPSNVAGAQSQRGATLLVCLVLLLGLTVVGVASMRETVVQQKSINAATEDDTAFQAAEFALRAGENIIFAAKSAPQPGLVAGSSPLYIFGSDELASEWWKNRSDATWDSGLTITTYPSSISSSQKAPSYVIEMMVTPPPQLNNTDENPTTNYRITARGFGVNDAYYVVLQSTVGKTF